MKIYCVTCDSDWWNVEVPKDLPQSKVEFYTDHTRALEAVKAKNDRLQEELNIEYQAAVDYYQEELKKREVLEAAGFKYHNMYLVTPDKSRYSIASEAYFVVTLETK